MQKLSANINKIIGLLVNDTVHQAKLI